MSYLNPLRLHFAGRFQAAPSTVNNDPTHFDSANFLPSYQQFGAHGTNGWWNPRGNADVRLIGCQVKSAWQDGKPVSGDSILQCLIADSNTRVAAKLVDLDPEQQMVSEIWGLEVRICTADGTTLVKGHFQPAAFGDIWPRFPTGNPDSCYSAIYQSVLVNLEWPDVSGSPFLTALKAASADRLSIKFNVDGYDDDPTSATFTLARIAGTIGPAAPDEPAHLVLGRHFLPTGPNPLNACVAAVDESAGLIYVDLGNALPTTAAGGPLQDLGTLTLACIYPNDAQNNPVAPLPLGTIPYQDANWYSTTAGVATVSVTGANLQQAQSNALGLLLTKSGQTSDGITEPLGGLYVRADRFVYRIEPGETAEVALYATGFGKRLAGATIVSIADSNGLQGPTPIGTPAGAIEFPCRLVTDARGVATLPIRTSDPGNPRGYIDGQLYGVRPMLQDTMSPLVGYPFNGAEFVSILLWSAYKSADPPTWLSLQPIFQQYANLYPVMDTFVNLADYDSVCQHRTMMLLAFGLPVADPNSMPVTRDLSPAKRAAILRWLQATDSDGKPLRGTAAPADAAAPGAVAATAAEPGQPSVPARGGKGAALARRKILKRTT